MRQERPQPTPEPKGVARELEQMRAKIAELEAELELVRRIPSPGYCGSSPGDCIHFGDDTLCIDCTHSPYFGADDMVVNK